MAKIDNLIEYIEEGRNFMAVFKQRDARVGDYKRFGPPDLCYFVREEKGGLFSQPRKAGFFHYVYGADTSSTDSVVKYMTDTLKQGPIEYSFLYK